MTKEAKREWKVDFRMVETDIAEDIYTTQREITHAIGRAIGSLAAQYKGLKITDYHFYCNGKEQPEAKCIIFTKKLPNQ